MLVFPLEVIFIIFPSKVDSHTAGGVWRPQHCHLLDEDSVCLFVWESEVIEGTRKSPRA